MTEKSTSGYVFTILYKHAEQYPYCLCSDNDSKATEPQKSLSTTKVQSSLQRTRHPTCSPTS